MCLRTSDNETSEQLSSLQMREKLPACIKKLKFLFCNCCSTFLKKFIKSFSDNIATSAGLISRRIWCETSLRRTRRKDTTCYWTKLKKCHFEPARLGSESNLNSSLVVQIYAVVSMDLVHSGGHWKTLKNTNALILMK
jgi:hypothetical protein